MKKKVYLRIDNNQMALYWAGNGWWTRRRDQAKPFATEAEAHLELNTVVSLETHDEEKADASVAEA